MKDETGVAIQTDGDILTARQAVRERAEKLGFSSTDLVLIATAISELARNMLLYAKRGEIVARPVANGAKRGIVVVARDQGPGIRDVAQAMQVGFSTSGNLGLGLPGVKRLMDEFKIVSKPGRGTTVTVTKWTH